MITPLAATADPRSNGVMVRVPKTSEDWTRSAAGRFAAAVLFLGISAILLATGLDPRPRWSDAVTSPARTVIDINTANAAGLQTLPTIGPARAAAVIEHRETHGPFRTVDDLANVPGLGPRTLRRLRPWIEASPGR